MSRTPTDTTPESQGINPDQALIHRFLAAPGTPVALDSNPFIEALNGQLRAVDAQAGRVALAFAPGPLFVQGAGVLQGGAVTAMLDFAMAFATLANLPTGAGCATVNLGTAFLRPAPVGTYLAEGWVERRGRALAFTQARLLRAKDGTVVATAHSTLAVLEG